MAEKCTGLLPSPAILDNVVLDADTMKSLKGNMQLLIDCMPEGALLSLNTSSINPSKTLIIKKSLTISSIHKEGTQIFCPKGKTGALEIRLALQISLFGLDPK